MSVHSTPLSSSLLLPLWNSTVLAEENAAPAMAIVTAPAATAPPTSEAARYGVGGAARRIIA